MSQQDDRDTGIPTRAIHEAYLNLQQAHRSHRQAHDDPTRGEDRAHAEFQDAVLTFYELIRPHLKRKGAMSSFWQGDLPKYPDRWWRSEQEARQYCERHGTAIWGFQRHMHTQATSPNADGDAAAVADGGGEISGTPSEWHARLNMSDNQRIVGVDRDDSVLYWVELRAVAGLRHLDSWDTKQAKSREQGAGFMAGETPTSVELEYVDIWKLTKAKRLLAEAADKMNLLSRVDIDHEDGAIVNFDQSREDARAEYRDAEYDSTPDI